MYQKTRKQYKIIKLELLLGGYQRANKPSMLAACMISKRLIGKIFYSINERNINTVQEKFENEIEEWAKRRTMI